MPVRPSKRPAPSTGVFLRAELRRGAKPFPAESGRGKDGARLRSPRRAFARYGIPEPLSGRSAAPCALRRAEDRAQRKIAPGPGPGAQKTRPLRRFCHALEKVRKHPARYVRRSGTRPLPSAGMRRRNARSRHDASAEIPALRPAQVRPATREKPSPSTRLEKK